MKGRTEDVLPHVSTNTTRNKALAILVLLLLSLVFNQRSQLRPSRRSPQPQSPALQQQDLLRDAQSSHKIKSYAHYEAAIRAKRSAWTLEQWNAQDEQVKINTSVSVILLVWKRSLDYHKLQLLKALRYPWIAEIIIWNNDGETRSISSKDFEQIPNPFLTPIKVYNAPSNTHDLSKHLACSIFASTPTCYFADEDWLNEYLEAGYTKYVDCCLGQRISSNTMPYIAWEHRRWRFRDPHVGLESSFTWLGTGTFSPRNFSTRFLQQVDVGAEDLGNSLRKDQKMTADMYFSIWTNSPVEQMSNELLPIILDDQDVSWSAGVDQWTIVYANILDATAKLHHVLSSQSRVLIPSIFPLSPNYDYDYEESDYFTTISSYLRAPCENDECLFVTTLNVFPRPPILKKSSSSSSISHTSRHFWNPHQSLPHPHFPISHITEYESLISSSSDFPSIKWWLERGSYHLAVDGKDDTCWESKGKPKNGDSIGLMFIRQRSFEKLRIVGNLKRERWYMQVSDGYHWFEVESNWEISRDNVWEIRWEIQGDENGTKNWKQFQLSHRGTGEENVKICALEAF